MPDLGDLFPNLQKHGFAITSPETVNYNCLAWAARDTERWWWPDEFELYYWPASIPREETIEAVTQAYATLGYVECASAALEPGFEKIAIYANASGIPTHAARQLLSGKWTSKLGELEDIERTLDSLADSDYGIVVRILKRPLHRTKVR